MCLCGKSQATNQIGTQTETGSTASRLTHGRDEHIQNSKSSSSSEGKERLVQFMGLLSDLDTDVGAFEVLVTGTDAFDERTSGRLDRMKRGLVNLRSESDERLNEVGFIVPGLGDAGDRQFGIQ